MVEDGIQSCLQVSLIDKNRVMQVRSLQATAGIVTNLRPASGYSFFHLPFLDWIVIGYSPTEP